MRPVAVSNVLTALLPMSCVTAATSQARYEQPDCRSGGVSRQASPMIPLIRGSGKSLGLGDCCEQGEQILIDDVPPVLRGVNGSRAERFEIIENRWRRFATRSRLWNEAKTCKKPLFYWGFSGDPSRNARSAFLQEVRVTNNSNHK